MLNFEYPCLDQIFTTKSSNTDTYNFEDTRTSSENSYKSTAIPPILDDEETTTQSQSIVFIILVSSMIPFGLTLLSIPTIVIITVTIMRCKFCVYIHSAMTDRFDVTIS